MFSRSLAFAALGLLAPLLLAGCSDGGARANGSSGGTPTTIHRIASAASEAGAPDEVPPTALAMTMRGNQLCHATFTQSCYPDDVVNACDLALFVDGGPGLEAADAGLAAACHVVAGAASPTTCLPAGLGFTNAACAHSTDCAAGHECVGTGACRHYCCDGNVACQINEFCDVQPTADDPTNLVPVCMPEVPCTLLNDDVCAPTQQCSVVREDGATSCVNVGTAKDGDPCDVEHCARGLVCIGPPNRAQCAPLCHTGKARECTAGRTCMGALPLFRDATIGACQ